MSNAKVIDAAARVAVIIPVFGRHHLTRTVLTDLARDNGTYDVWLVDNGGDFEPKQASVTTVRPATNLGWARGCNYGVQAAWGRPYRGFVLLNNDVRLSVSFVKGLVAGQVATGGDVIGPMYDHNWPHQRGTYVGEASSYRARTIERMVPFVDGTCMFVRRSVFERVGFLDEQHWPKYEWGCDKDFALRVRATGGSVWVTERSYLNHFGRQTAATLEGYSEFEAERENDLGMATKWGPNWLNLLYEGFSDVPRRGLVQERLKSSQ